jgi:hypothetical protein
MESLRTGDFEHIQRDRQALPWKDLPGAEGRYSVAIALSLSELYDPEKTLLTQVKEVQKNSSVKLHLRQNFWLNDSEAEAGTRISLYACVLAPDDSIIMSEKGPVLFRFDETAKYLSRAKSVPKLNNFQDILTKYIRRNFLSLSKLFANPSAVQEHSFCVKIRIRVRTPACCSKRLTRSGT